MILSPGNMICPCGGFIQALPLGELNTHRPQPAKGFMGREVISVHQSLQLVGVHSASQPVEERLFTRETSRSSQTLAPPEARSSQLGGGGVPCWPPSARLRNVSLTWPLSVPCHALPHLSCCPPPQNKKSPKNSRFILLYSQSCRPCQRCSCEGSDGASAGGRAGRRIVGKARAGDERPSCHRGRRRNKQLNGGQTKHFMLCQNAFQSPTVPQPGTACKEDVSADFPPDFPGWL